jgi:DNA modification methylase
VWEINPKPFSEAHFAVFPEELVVIPLKAGCPKDGIVLDPFMGAGTTALVALKQNKRFVGIELNQEYIEIANKRIGGWREQCRLDSFLYPKDSTSNDGEENESD